jgi:hypothetical protein
VVQYLIYNREVQGVGAYLTTTGTFHYIDTGNVQTVGTRILVKNEANAAWNGVYTYTNTTTITRATDEDQNADLAGGDFLFVTSGDVNADTGWVQTTDSVVIGIVRRIRSILCVLAHTQLIQVLV